MLTTARSLRHTAPARARQQGVVMMVALVVLVVMTLAGIALMRSMDTTNLIAGNMAFKQSATHAADSGVEQAIAWLEGNNAGSFLDNPHPEVGYTPSSPNNAGLGWGEAHWNGLTASGVCNLPMAGGVCSPSALPNAAGNQVSFMIQRLCAAAGNRNSASCSIVTGTVVSSGNNEGTEEQLTSTSTAVYYRITVRVAGPRNTVSYVQAIVSL
jgi:type IV pilus assembly protein PilX